MENIIIKYLVVVKNKNRLYLVYKVKMILYEKTLKIIYFIILLNSIFIKL